jgi:hypothetical protein
VVTDADKDLENADKYLLDADIILTIRAGV